MDIKYLHKIALLLLVFSATFVTLLALSYLQEEFEDTNWLIRIRK